MKTVAIVGGGFCGTLAAVNLARLAKCPLRIVIINNGTPLGRGIAYSTKQSEHLLNVAARNMSAFPDQPNHFLEWLGTRTEYADVPEAVLREQFVPRKIYGDYLQGLLFFHSQSNAVPPRHIEFVNGEVLDLVPGPEGIAVVVGQQPTIEADKVILATGNQAPAEWPAGNYEQPRFVSNPWRPLDLSGADRRENVVLIGAGLTMIDIFLTLSALAWQGTIYAVSRTGLLPLPHFQGIAYADFPPADPMGLGLAGLTKLMELHCKLLRDRGENPAIVVDKLRPFTQRVWQSFTDRRKAGVLPGLSHALERYPPPDCPIDSRTPERGADQRQVATYRGARSGLGLYREWHARDGGQKVARQGACDPGCRLGGELYGPAGELQKLQDHALSKLV